MKLKKTTKRLIIRPLDKNDYKAWLDANTKSLPPQNPWDIKKKEKNKLTKKEFLKIIKFHKKNLKEDEAYHFALFLKKNGSYIGIMSLMSVTRNIFQNAFLGYFIFNNHWRQGYAKEAGMAILKIAFNELNLHRVEAAINPKNKPSIALANSLGLTKKYLSRKHLYTDKKWNDFMIYAATSEEFGIKWKAVKKA